MTDFEILFCIVGITVLVVGAIHVTIVYRSINRDIEPDPDRVRRFLENAQRLRSRQGSEGPKADDKEKERD